MAPRVPMLSLATVVSMDFFLRQDVIEPELCFLASAAVGFPVSIYRVEMDEGPEYQVMRWDESPGPGKEFWDKHLWDAQQFFSSPIRAATAFVAAWHEWDAKPAGVPFR